MDYNTLKRLSQELLKEYEAFLRQGHRNTLDQAHRYTHAHMRGVPSEWVSGISVFLYRRFM